MEKLGISIYPIKETLEKDIAYIEKAAHNGFTRLFTCLQSAKGEKDELIHMYTDLIYKAHDLGFEVSADTSPYTFHKFGATPMDVKVFHEMGIDIIRLDTSFGLFGDLAIINNPYGIKVEMNGSMITGVEALLENGADSSRILICHNFYPQRYTGLDIADFVNLNDRWKKLNLRTAAFISSNNTNTIGPWPVSDGLPTCEVHRDLPIDIQLRHMVALKQVDDILIGNVYASDEELALLSKVDLSKPTLKIMLEDNLFESEKEIVFNHVHNRRMDCSSYMIRSSFTRIAYKEVSIPPRIHKKDYFTKGDVVIVNDNLSHYRGELQVVLRDMKNDGVRNYVGRIKEEEFVILDSIKPGQSFSFIN